ncbi:SET domain-containing protein-lysine N-methyltransferase [Mesorhizobium waimense]|uniref:SET domain-containing protein-lysine N-methyltransferase n=1 Tax=Mesorhizobium waimense TaxID=1300307 RepID=A0A3A5K3F7_9HYPH|nr:SET domain-containing protein-lysine N-methyltransferase [Mesorhizobium waimense]
MFLCACAKLACALAKGNPKPDSYVRRKPLEAIRTTNSIQLDWDIHALFERPAVIANHSCDPNLAIVPNRFGAHDFIANQEIFSGVEVTWDYATSEFECFGVSVCLCSAANCRGAAGGFSKLPLDHPMLVSRFYASYLSRGNPAYYPREMDKSQTLSAPSSSNRPAHTAIRRP